ncbi:MULTISPECIES: hypothetical protein [unclassified Polaribacter]|uniref:hypothetical protein n=1 Tax=unclassified Polaribacter TaxID=196858 RepID=UPI0011BE0E37|nr:MULTISPECIES: hypothetical protein [unclassified Polaribacter]TXD53897.1 hypothetical protein ES043_02390 [Polaribacter sp. IC063]TXD58533.1 hypothetical protein ES044_12085 [Polaribacter sp. IC066]
MAKNITLHNRINTGLALTIVLLLVFATNRIDKRHFDTVQNAVTTLHTDRVVAQDFIYKMNTIIYKKQLHIMSAGPKTIKEKLNENFFTLIEEFSETKLTTKESKLFNRLKDDFEQLIETEKKVSKDNLNEKGLIKNLNIIKKDLISLSEIQISESRRLTSIAQKSLDTNTLMSNLEIGFLLLIGLILQYIIFYRVKKTKKTAINE